MLLFVEKQTVAEFGHGNIGCKSFVDVQEEVGGLVFYNVLSQEIGSITETDPKQEDDKLILIFSKMESLDVVIENLQILKKQMEDVL